MKTIEIEQPPNPLWLYLGALRSARKGAATPIEALPELRYVRPRVALDAAHIARYARICGFSHAQGVPITYPQMLTFPLLMAFFASAECPWPALGTVHLANRIRQYRRLDAGDELRVELATGRLIAHDKGQVFTLEMKAWHNDEVAWEATQTLLRIGVAHPRGPAFASELGAVTELSRQADFRASRSIGRRYGRVSGDLNPIHLSTLSARMFGFRRAIAHGMWTKARALAALMPRAVTGPAEVSVEFKTPLFLPVRASLWTSHRESGTLFEVRNAAGDRPHLRGRLSF